MSGHRNSTGDALTTLAEGLILPSVAQGVSDATGMRIGARIQNGGSSVGIYTSPQMPLGTSHDPRAYQPQSVSLNNAQVPQLDLIDIAQELSRCSTSQDPADRARVPALAQRFADTANTLAGAQGGQIFMPNAPAGTTLTYNTDPVRLPDGRLVQGRPVTMLASGTPSQYAASLFTQFNASPEAIVAVNTAINPAAAAPAPAPAAAAPAPAPAAAAPAPAAVTLPTIPPADGAPVHLYSHVDAAKAPVIKQGQVQAVQQMIMAARGDAGVGSHKDDGKWGRDTQAGFEALCTAAGVDPHSVDFTTNPPNENTAKFIAEVQKEAAARSATAPAPAAAAPAPAAAAPAPAAAASAPAAPAPAAAASAPAAPAIDPNAEIRINETQLNAPALSAIMNKLASALPFPQDGRSQDSRTQAEVYMALETKYAGKTAPGGTAVAADGIIHNGEAITIARRMEAEAVIAGPNEDQGHKDMRASFEQILAGAGIDRSAYQVQDMQAAQAVVAQQSPAAAVPQGPSAGRQ